VTRVFLRCLLPQTSHAACSIPGVPDDAAIGLSCCRPCKGRLYGEKKIYITRSLRGDHTGPDVCLSQLRQHLQCLRSSSNCLSYLATKTETMHTDIFVISCWRQVLSRLSCPVLAPNARHLLPPQQPPKKLRFLMRILQRAEKHNTPLPAQRPHCEFISAHECLQFDRLHITRACIGCAAPYPLATA
jgi:hypothetical protein